MSTPETPSTRQWWVLQTIAKRSSSSPSTSHISHIGFVAVELLGEHAAGEVAQLLLARRGREGGVADVVVEVEVGVVDPDRPALVERDERELLAKARHQVQPGLQVLAELVVGGRRAVEDHRRGDVHVGPVALEVQERGVEAGEPVGTHRTEFFTFVKSVTGPHKQTFDTLTLPRTLQIGNTRQVRSIAPFQEDVSGGPTGRRDRTGGRGEPGRDRPRSP